MTSKGLDTTQVEEWLHAVREDKARLEERLSPLLEERGRLEEQEGILMELLASLDGSSVASSDTQPTPAGTPIASGSTIRERVEARVIEILRDAGEPLHINEIHSRYRERGWKVPGAGKPVNITSHIRESSQIASPKRGIYGLAEQVGPLPPRKTAKRKKKVGSR